MDATFQLDQVNIRMYRPGLGDCFLLTFQGKNNERRYMLIDCGVLQNTRDQEGRLGKIIQDIKEHTGGVDGARGKLDIVVATHEHMDHISGFIFHQSRFKQEFDIEDIWLAWTENKQDPLVAQAYSSVRNTPQEALREAINMYAGVPEAEIPQAIKNVKKLFEFVADGGMDSVKALGGTVHYLRPNTDPDLGPTKVIPREDFGGVQFHVLAPSEDPKYLEKNDLPKNKNQIYQGQPINQATALTAALLKFGKPSGFQSLSELDIEELSELCLPFDGTQAIPLGEAKKDSFFRQHYGFADEPSDETPAWRRIDDDWLEAGSQLALDLDGDTNNTSLVLAIELSQDGKVLLFCGDAQHGNWLSWARTPNGAGLLKRTVFYKVGHHGSNNATLVPGGLDQMSADGLVAMIPVDPVRQPNYKMPNAALKARLLAQTQGRLIQACDGTKPEELCPGVDFKPPVEKPEDMSQEVWNGFIQLITWDTSPDRLWVEYSVPL